jgi:hypothetical protein
MLATILKALATAAFIAVLSEVAKRSTWLAAVMVALPLATMLTVGFTYWNTKDAEIATRFATSTFMLVWPGLTFFILLPLGQKMGLHFWAAFAIAVVATFGATWGFTMLLRSLGVKM